VNELLEAALRYAAHGWPVFPLRPGLKRPQTRHGFEDATTDPAKIRYWWGGVAAFNIGLATGAPGPDVLDVDVKHGDGRQALRQLAAAGLTAGACAMIRTRSGGLHLYFQGTGQANGRLREHDLDFRGRGGYVVAPPSYVEADDSGPGGRYEVIEKRAAAGCFDWAAAVQLLTPPRPPARPVRPPGAPGEMTPARCEGILATVTASNTAGHWDDTLFWAACRFAEAGVPQAEAERLIVAAAQPWDGRQERLAARKVASAYQRVAVS
jgi:Bifunctional DNA primase/polymerase, N-terminal